MSSTALPEKKIVWLASYPKSGNTWFRAFLTALLNDDDLLDINYLKTDGIFSSRQIFDNYTDLDSRDFYAEEVKILQPEIFNYLASVSQKQRLFIKIHDAYTFNSEGKPIVPNESTSCAIYFIRNPLDVAASLANHAGSTIDKALKRINDPLSKLCDRDNLNTDNQFTQLTCDWSGHVKSWTDNSLPFPVLVLRYEDMLADSFGTFSKAISFMGIDSSPEKIKAAIMLTKFERLQQQEREGGFSEKPARSAAFFRTGQAGNWKNELNAQQIASIAGSHQYVMSLFNYPIDT